MTITFYLHHTIFLLCSGFLCAEYLNVYTVTTVLEEPYAMMSKGTKPSNMLDSPNGVFQGYLVDLIQLLSEKIGFRYHIVPVFDGEYGVKLKDRTWNGMIGEILKENADIAAGPMFVTPGRARAVDFTEPFLTVQACLVMRKEVFGGPSGIESASDLLFESDSVAFGTLDRGIVRKNFKQANTTLSKGMYNNMEKAYLYAYTKSNKEGLERVRREQYVYIMPDNIAEYMVLRQPCDLKIVDRFLMSERLSLAVKKNSHLLYEFNHHLALFRQDQTLDTLYHKWWYMFSDCDLSKQTAHSFDASNNGLRDETSCLMPQISLIIYMLILCILIMLTNS